MRGQPLLLRPPHGLSAIGIAHQKQEVLAKWRLLRWELRPARASVHCIYFVDHPLISDPHLTNRACLDSKDGPILLSVLEQQWAELFIHDAVPPEEVSRAKTRNFSRAWDLHAWDRRIGRQSGDRRQQAH